MRNRATNYVKGWSTVRAALFVGGLSSRVFADDSSVEPETGEPAQGLPRPEELRPRTEVGLIPVAGGSSDVGIAVGVVGNVTRVAPKAKPYVWNAEAAGLISFKSPQPGESSLQIPYQDYYVQFTAPDLVPHKLRLIVRPSFTDESTLKYYGLGNASVAPTDGAVANSREFEYRRTHPTLQVNARLNLSRRVFVLVGNSYTENWLEIRPGSKLANDLTGGSPFVRKLLDGPTQHGVYLSTFALQYDSRDNEISTKKGQYHSAQVRVSPGGVEALPYRYLQGNITTRFYFTPVPRYLTFAVRFVADVLVGDPPFYELARFSEDTFAFGGSKGVRGIPAQRYYGKVKAFGNFEVRSEWFAFRAFSKSLVLGPALFFDAGRLWTDFDNNPELDGTRVGLKYGAGGGLRLQQGSAFVVRADVAWSPDSTPIGGYFEVGQIF